MLYAFNEVIEFCCEGLRGVRSCELEAAVDGGWGSRGETSDEEDD